MRFYRCADGKWVNSEWPTPEWREQFAETMLPILVQRFGPTTLEKSRALVEDVYRERMA